MLDTKYNEIKAGKVYKNLEKKTKQL